MLGAGARGTRPPAAAPALRQMLAEQLSPQPAPGNASERGEGTERARSRREAGGLESAGSWRVRGEGVRWALGEGGRRAGAGRAR